MSWPVKGLAVGSGVEYGGNARHPCVDRTSWRCRPAALGRSHGEDRDTPRFRRRSSPVAWTGVAEPACRVSCRARRDLALQSSTATGMMATSFLADGVIGLMPALAVMLGANAGTALVVWALSFDITVVFPALIFIGLVIFRTGTRTRSRNLGRATIGLGLVLLSLHLLVETVVPDTVAPEARELISAITREPLPVLVMAALITWAMHSSIAAVLVIVSLADSGLVTPLAALAMVLGANLGSALNPAACRDIGRPQRTSVAGRQPVQPDRRLRRGAALPAGSRRVSQLGRARSREDGGGVSSALQRGAGRSLHPAAGVAGQAAGKADTGPAPAGRSGDAPLSGRWLRSIRQEWRSPTPRARRCAWRMWSRRC